jgi:hypothetical protein
MRFPFGVDAGFRLGGGLTGRWCLLLLLSGTWLATGFLRVLPTLCARRGSVEGVFQRLAGIVSAPCRSRERDLIFRQLAGGLGGVSSASWCSERSSAVGRAVPPRSGRLLGRSLEKNSVTDLDRFFLLTASEAACGLPRREIGETVMFPDIWGCRRGDDWFRPCRALPRAVEAMT